MCTGAPSNGTLRLRLAVTQLRSLGPDLEPALEPGTVEILVGPSAEHSSLLSGRLQVSST